jgi:peptide/nickel transport system permease protein
LTLFIVRRLIQAGFVLLLVSLVVFFGVYAVGDPVELLISPEASPAARAMMIERLGLDQPPWMQYLVFLGHAVQGDLGTSFVHGVPTIRLIVERMPATLELVTLAILMAVVIGLPIGMAAGARPNARLCRGGMTSSVSGFSLPNFWQAMLLLTLFYVVAGSVRTAVRVTTRDGRRLRRSVLTGAGNQ